MARILRAKGSEDEAFVNALNEAAGGAFGITGGRAGQGADLLETRDWDDLVGGVIEASYS